MNDRSRREHEAAAILMAAVAGEASAGELATLDGWIRHDAALGEFVVDLMNQESWLSWHAAAPPASGDAPDQVCHVLQAASMSPASGGTPKRSSRNQLALAAALLVAMGALLGSAATRWWAPREVPDALVALDAPAEAVDASRYVARFVHGTACLWNPETTSLSEVRGALRTGESLNLLEGLAEFQVDWATGAANFKLEGPASLVLTAQRGASLSRGRFTANVQLSDGAFVLGTPNGQVEVSKDASIGVAVHGDAVELHVFRGAATFVTPWGANLTESDRVAVASGESMTISGGDDGRMRQVRAVARPSDFVSQTSMRSDDLVISQEYVDEVLRGKPAVYWRFEGESAGVVRNEAGDRYNGRVEGSVAWINQRDNGNVELGSGLTPEAIQAYILSDQPLTEDLSAAYTVEMWIKPSHYHWGSVVSLIGAPPQPGRLSVHGMLLELGGPITVESSIERPGRLRFLHRSPPSDDLNKGTSCFSQAPYELRKWQHVAVVKEGAQMRLFVNGQLVATGEDESQLPAGLRVIVGQLDENRLARPFAGQLDELAVYPRALSAGELSRRYELIRNQPAPLGGIRARGI